MLFTNYILILKTLFFGAGFLVCTIETGYWLYSLRGILDHKVPALDWIIPTTEKSCLANPTELQVSGKSEIYKVYLKPIDTFEVTWVVWNWQEILTTYYKFFINSDFKLFFNSAVLEWLLKLCCFAIILGFNFKRIFKGVKNMFIFG